MNYQGVAVRFVAIVIDSIVLAVIFGVLGLFFGIFNYPMNTPNVFLYYGATYNLLTFIIYIAYFTLLEGYTGRTIGKAIMKIRVVKEDGGRLDIGSAFVRNILRVIDALFLYLVGAVVIWRTSKKQRIGDLAAKTVVIKA